jgi:hypothetical protein
MMVICAGLTVTSEQIPHDQHPENEHFLHLFYRFVKVTKPRAPFLPSRRVN